jgi:hypothetical protein
MLQVTQDPTATRSLAGGGGLSWRAAGTTRWRPEIWEPAPPAPRQGSWTGHPCPCATAQGSSEMAFCRVPLVSVIMDHRGWTVGPHPLPYHPAQHTQPARRLHGLRLHLLCTPSRQLGTSEDSVASTRLTVGGHAAKLNELGVQKSRP